MPLRKRQESLLFYCDYLQQAILMTPILMILKSGQDKVDYGMTKGGTEETRCTETHYAHTHPASPSAFFCPLHPLLPP